MHNLFIRTGETAYHAGIDAISSDALGVRYGTYRNLFRFQDQTEDLNVGLIVWPGGALSEQHEDRYGFEFEGLYNPTTGKPSIADMMAESIDQGTGLSVLLWTARYVGRLDDLRDDIQGFMQDLLGGHYGEMPDQMILEVGDEFYANFNNTTASGAATDYAAIADIMVTEIALALADSAINTAGSDVTIAVQSGRAFAED